MPIHQLLSCILVLAAIKAGAASNEEVCAYAMKKTKGMVPDLCMMMRKDDNLNAQWHAALASRKSRTVPSLLLAGGAGILALIAATNMAQEIDGCYEYALQGGPEDDCSDDSGPVVPLVGMSAALVIADIFVLAWPNQALERALAATREAQAVSAPDTKPAQPDSASSPGVSRPAEAPAAEKPDVSCDGIEDPALRFDCGKKRINP